MSFSIGDQIKQIVKQTISEIRTFKVDKIIGASGLCPARLEFTVDGKCLYNGVEIGSGSGTGTSSGSSDDGDLSTWMSPAPADKDFEWSAWGSFSAISLPSSVVEHPGLYVSGFHVGKCAFVTSDKVLPTNRYAARVYNSDSSQIRYSGGDPYLLAGDFGSAWAFYVDDISSSSITAHLTKDSNTVASNLVINANSDYVYYGTMGDGTTNFPCCAVRVGNTLLSGETNQVEIQGGFALDTAVTATVDLSAVGVFLSDPSPVDMQDEQLILSDGSYIQDNGDGTLVVDGDIQVAIKANGTTALDIESDEIKPLLPINMGGVAITSGKSSFASNELPNLSYIEALIATSAPDMALKLGSGSTVAFEYSPTYDALFNKKDIDMGGKSLHSMSGIFSSGNVLIGTGNTIPYFPQGIAIGTSAASTESIGFSAGVMRFLSSSGFAFDGKVTVNGYKLSLNASETAYLQNSGSSILVNVPSGGSLVIQVG